MRLKVGSVDRSLRRAGSVMIEGWSGASAVAKMLRSQRRERLVIWSEQGGALRPPPAASSDAGPWAWR